MFLLKLSRGIQAFEFNEKLNSGQSTFGNVDTVRKKFAWFPKSVYFSETSPHRVLIWFNSYYEIFRPIISRTDESSVSSFSSKTITCLNRFVPHPQKRILPLGKAIDAISYYNSNRAKVASLLRQTNNLEIMVPPSNLAFSDWSSSHWKYLAIQTNSLYDKMLNKSHVELIPLLDEVNY